MKILVQSVGFVSHLYIPDPDSNRRVPKLTLLDVPGNGVGERTISVHHYVHRRRYFSGGYNRGAHAI